MKLYLYIVSCQMKFTEGKKVVFFSFDCLCFHEHTHVQMDTHAHMLLFVKLVELLQLQQLSDTLPFGILVMKLFVFNVLQIQ